MFGLFALLLTLTLAQTTYAADILFMPSSLFPVHRYNMKHLAEELVRRGHHITWFEYGLAQPKDALPEGVTEVFLRVNTPNQAIRDVYQHHNHSSHTLVWSDSFWDEAAQSSAWLASIELCDQLLSNKEHRSKFENLVSRRFDSVVLDDLYNPCGLFHTGLQQSVFVYWSMTGMRTESAWANQSPSPPSYIPVPGTGLTDELDFWERSFNLASYLRAIYVHQHMILRRIDELAHKHFPNQLPEAFYLERNASINFINHPPIFDFPRPYMPRVNFVGGLHCHKPKQLPEDLNNFVEQANDQMGFILISSGNSKHWQYAPESVKKTLLEVITTKSSIRFIWQYDGAPLENQPTNLLIRKWLPQQDLLGHAKCRAHITHGGLNSVIESVWHGVPVIGWPLTAANYDNLLRVTTRNAGLMLAYKQPTRFKLLVLSDNNNLFRHQLISALNRIYLDHYKEEAIIFQDMLVDVPYTELNHSAFWVEFIVRHQEVPHARSGADQLNILQYFLVDVVLFIVSALIVVVTLVYYFVKLTLSLLLFIILKPFKRGQPRQPEDPRKKNN